MSDSNSKPTNVIAMNQWSTARDDERNSQIEAADTATVQNPLQLDLIPRVQPDLFADVAFELGFGR